MIAFWPGARRVDVDAENLLGLYFFFEDLRARLGVVFCGDDDVDAAVERSGAEFRIERDGEARLRAEFFAGDGLRSGLENCGRRGERDERQEACQSVDEILAGEFARERCDYLVTLGASEFSFAIHRCFWSRAIVAESAENVCGRGDEGLEGRRIQRRAATRWLQRRRRRAFALRCRETSTVSWD